MILEWLNKVTGGVTFNGAFSESENYECKIWLTCKETIQ